MEALRRLIREVPDFPKPGILFKDITTLLKDAEGFRAAVDAVTDPYRDPRPDVVVGIESRGFILGAAVADRLGVGFVPVRKPGKLPWRTTQVTYDLEYGSDTLEIHDDALAASQRALVKRCGARVAGLSFLVELTALEGRGRLAGERVVAALQY